MLELIDLTVARGGALVVEGLTRGIEPGRVFWVVGPNGSGKTSLLRVVAGLDRPRSGQVRWVVGETPLYFQSEMALPAAATAAGWDRLARRLATGAAGSLRRGSLWPEVAERAPVRRLSTGERKRLLLDVLLRRPGSLVLDEPFEHLSPDAKASLESRLRERARSGRVVVVATNQATGRVRVDGGLVLGDRISGGRDGPGAATVSGVRPMAGGGEP